MPDHWFEPIADHLGGAYLRYSFTKGTRQEIDFLVEVLGLRAGDRVLDVGCGPGRHCHELARQGIRSHGVDISERFIDLARKGAPDGATFERADARSLDFDAAFDAVISLCQGGFGLLDGGAQDASVIAGMVAAVRPGGRLAFSAFSAYFQVRYLGESTFDAGTGINHEHTIVKNEAGHDKPVELWTSCWTPKELRFVCAAAGLTVDHLWSVEPGAYAPNEPSIELPEYLVVAHR